MTEAGPSAPPAVPRRGLVLAACMMATFVVAIESSIVGTALPTITAELGGFRLFSWVFAASLLAQAVTVPIYGRHADVYGRKRVFFVGAETLRGWSSDAHIALGLGAPLLVLVHVVLGKRATRAREAELDDG